MKDLCESLIRTVGERVRASDDDARAVYSSLCNIQWLHPENTRPTCLSFRNAAACVAELRAPAFSEDYLDWYCSAQDGIVAPWIAEALAAEGWLWAYWPDEEEGAPGHDPEAPRA